MTIRSLSVATVLAICMSSTFAAVTAAAQDQTETRIPVNFQNVDIYTLIETVSLHTGRNFIVDPRVRARVNVVSSEDVDADGLYQLFISVLAIHGYTAVPAGSLTKIVPTTVGLQSGPVPLVTGRLDDEELVTEVVQLRTLVAQEVADALRPLLSASASISAESMSNSIVITDHATNIERLLELISEMQ